MEGSLSSTVPQYYFKAAKLLAVLNNTSVHFIVIGEKASFAFLSFASLLNNADICQIEPCYDWIYAMESGVSVSDVHIASRCTLPEHGRYRVSRIPRG